MSNHIIALLANNLRLVNKIAEKKDLVEQNIIIVKDYRTEYFDDLFTILFAQKITPLNN